MHNEDRIGVAANARTQLAHGEVAHPLAPFLNRITHGDCFKLLPTIPKESVDLVVTDPPYLVGYKTRDGHRAFPNDDSPRWLKPVFRELFRVLKPNTFCVSFYGWAKADYFLQAWRAAGFHPVGHLIWTQRFLTLNKKGPRQFHPPECSVRDPEPTDSRRISILPKRLINPSSRGHQDDVSALLDASRSFPFMGFHRD